MKLKTLTIKELRAKKPAELEKYIAELKKSQSELHHAIYTNKESKTHQVGVIKRAIAQAHTVLGENKEEEK